MTTQDFIQTIHDAGIQTRIIECLIDMEFQQIQDNKEIYLKEYQMLGESGNDIISQTSHFISKEKNTTNMLVLELLTQIYQKLSRIEKYILQEHQILIPLEHKGTINALGHGIIGCSEAYFTPKQEYYIRLCLPYISQRIIGLFAHSIDTHILLITASYSYDTDALDSFIVSKEMEYLRQKRIKHD